MINVHDINYRIIYDIMYDLCIYKVYVAFYGWMEHLVWNFSITKWKPFKADYGSNLCKDSQKPNSLLKLE